jgi:hypothetical protein
LATLNGHLLFWGIKAFNFSCAHKSKLK